MNGETDAIDIESLQPQLNRFCADYLKNTAPAHVERIERTTSELIASRFAEQALHAGEIAPDFALPNQHWRIVRLGKRLEQGPVVLFFFRGMWCPYCNLTLRAYSRLFDPLRAAGGSLMAISPQTPEVTEQTARLNGLEFDVLSDVGSEIAASFRVAFALPPALLQLYLEVGHALPEFNGADDGVLPIPATFVIGREGIVQFAHVDADYRKRLEPAEALQIVRLLALDRRRA